MITVITFLNKQAIYQINKPTRHIVYKPLLSSSCGERLAIDLICVENLSEYRKVWAKPLKN